MGTAPGAGLSFLAGLHGCPVLVREIKVGVRLPGGPRDTSCIPFSIIPSLPASRRGQSHMVVC